MNKLISREHDKFSEATETSTKEFSWGEAEFSLHHISNPEGGRSIIKRSFASVRS